MEAYCIKKKVTESFKEKKLFQERAEQGYFDGTTKR